MTRTTAIEFAGPRSHLRPLDLVLILALVWAVGSAPAGATVPALGLSTTGDATGSTAPGLTAWSSSTVLSFSDPNLEFEPGGTNGWFEAFFSLDLNLATTDIGSQNNSAYDVILQADGKVLVAGESYNGLDFDFALARYNADATLDTSFSGDGVVTTAVGLTDDNGRSVTVQSDGKILVAGFTTNNLLNKDFALARYNVDGTPDISFSGGFVTTPIGAGDDQAKSVAVQSDGKILVAGRSHNGLDWDFAVVRYNTDGSLDASFSGGVVTTDFGADSDDGRSLAVQPDGKILVAGFSQIGPDQDFALVRYNTDGTLDNTFSGDGKVTTAIGAGIDRGRAVTVAADGRILVAGDSSNGANPDFALVRYNTDGTLDSTFSGDGMVTTDFASDSDIGTAVTEQADGKILVAGYSTSGAQDDFALVRYNSDGTLDTGFSGDGKLTTAIGAGDDKGREVILQPDGRILVAGETHNGANWDFALVRYNALGDDQVSLNGLHFVSTNITVGTTTTMDLSPGDLLLTIGGGVTKTLESTTTITVDNEDVFLFRPDRVGDYSSGTFTMVIDGGQLGLGTTKSVTLVEQDTLVGATLVPKGTFLFSQTTNSEDIYQFLPTDVGEATTSGPPPTVLIDGSDIGFTTAVGGLDLIEEDTPIGDVTLQVGRILVALPNQVGAVAVGGTGTLVDRWDVFYLDVTTAGPTTIADAFHFFDGDAVTVGFDGTSGPANAVSLRTSAPVVIDGDFSDWDNGIGYESCIDDEAGADDWTSPARLDITRFCIATNTVDELYVVFGFDDVSLSGNNESTACVLLDTPPNNQNADYFFCVTLEDLGAGTTVKEIGAYPCPDTQPFDCYPRGAPLPGFTPVYGFSNTQPGPFDAADSLVELLIPWSDIGISAGEVVFTAMISYPGQSAADGDLNNPEDSIFGGLDGGGNPYQDYEKKLYFDIETGKSTTTPVTLAWLQVEELGRSRVRVEWMTSTETANVGFHLYAVGEAGLERLNEEIIPSKVIDSLEPQRYSFEAWGVEAREFVLEDVDLLGKSRYHGPFRRGEARGREPEPERIAWGEIRAGRAQRQAARRGRLAGAGLMRGPGGVVSRRNGPRHGEWGGARLEVSADGIYRVSYEQLLAAGVDLTGAPLESLALTAGGAPVALRVEAPSGFILQSFGHGAGRRFGPGAYVEFVGQALDTLYTRANVYRLTVDPELALRVERERRPAAPWASAPASYTERLTVDRDRKYILTAPGEDPWYEAHLLAYGGSASAEFVVEVDGYAGGAAELEVELWGLSEFPLDPDHHVELEWNGSRIGEEWFDGRRAWRVSTELWSGAVVEGENRLKLVLPGDTGTTWDMVAFDRLWLRYARRFEPRAGRLRFAASGEAFEIQGVSGEAVAYRLGGEVPVLLEGLSHLGDRVRLPGYRGPRVGTRSGGEAPGAIYEFAELGALKVPGIAPLTEPAELVGPAELLVIGHEEFLAGIQPLVDARRAEGWTVAVVDIAEVYARQSHGVVNPWAIRKFIRDAAAEHATEAVLLVGGDTYDYHDNLGVGSISFIPSLYAATDPVVLWAPVDPLYGDVDSDGVPDVSVGRLPVRTPEELASVVARTLEYGAIGFAGTALLAADRYDVTAGYSFTAASEHMAAVLDGWQATRAYIDELGRDEARARLIAGINAGVALTSYFGHSGPTAWSFENLFGTSDAATLENWGRPTVVTQWGCWNNYHVTPSYNTLAHKLLLSGDRGAAAVLGAATLTQARAERRLGNLLFARLARPGATLGRALVEAKQTLATTEPDLVDVILGWTLLGDPTIRIEQGAPDRDRRRAGRGR